MPNKQEQTLLDAPELGWGGGKKTEAQMVAGRPTPYAPSGEALAPPSLAERVRRGRFTAPSELTGTQATPNEDAQTAGLSATGLAAVVDPLMTARGVAGGFAGTVAGGKGGHYLGGIPGRALHNPKMEKEGEGYGEAIGAGIGGVTGSILGAGGLPLKAKVAGLPVEVGGAEAAAAPAEASRIVTPQQAAEFAGRNSAALGKGGTWVDLPQSEQSLLQRIQSMSPTERQRWALEDAVSRMKPSARQGSELVDPYSFEKGYKPR